MRRIATFALALAACSGRSQIALQYKLDGIDPTSVVRVETVVAVDSPDARQFFADLPFHSAGQGVGYEVRDLDGSGIRKLLISFDSGTGYKFKPTFGFTILPPPDEKAPPLVLSTTVYGGQGAVIGTVVGEKATFSSTIIIDVKDNRCNGTACGANQMCCDNACASIATDLDNCGACGNRCGQAGDSCTGGICRCAGASACTGSTTCCLGLGCVDLTSDPFNCGGCGHACNPGEACVSGKCDCGGNGQCTDPVAPLCCGASCATGGACGCGLADCAFPDVCCGGATCTDVSSDNANCGTCGRACDPSLQCNLGECTCNGIVCSASDTCCDDGCKNLTNDPANCGACGHACNAGELCVNSQCQCGSTGCSADQTCCGSACAATQSDVMHCGSCSRVCRPGESCTSGACSCPANNGDACTGNQTCCGDGCFDLTNDASHCGTCTTVCGAGFACMSGKCVQTDCIPACSQGNVCVSTTCECNGGTACVAPSVCCTSGCSLLNDTTNCGMCGRACAPGDVCQGGNCLHPLGAMCSDGTECESTLCVDGVCCDSACAGTCFACNVTGNVGKCTPVPKGGSDASCAVQPPATCGSDGKCDGNGNCEKYPQGTVCKASVCNATTNTFTSASKCDGNGGCNAGTSRSCAPYACANTQQCATTCMASNGAGCAPPGCVGTQLITYVCISAGGTAGTCQSTQQDCKPYACQPGGGGAQCGSGNCASILGLGCDEATLCAPGCTCQGALCSGVCGGC